MFLGIDGGGTRCRARLVDTRGEILGEGGGGSANIGLGLPAVVAAIGMAVAGAFDAAGLDRSRMAEAVAGVCLAGANIPSLTTAFPTCALPFPVAAVASDAVAACLGAHGGRDGAILIVGTGSQGVAMQDGVTVTLGGWGFALGDDASGAVLGRALIRAAIRAFDGIGPSSPLTEAVMESFGHDPARAVVWARNASPGDYGAYAPMLFEAAAAGDGVAAPVVRGAAQEVEVLLRRLGGLTRGPVALMGGLAQPFLPWLGPTLADQLAQPRGDAMDGAILLARRASAL